MAQKRTPPPAGNQRQRIILVAVGLLLVAGGVYLFWPGSPTAPPIPPSAPLPPLSESPFLNTKPNVAYVGDQSCNECHADYNKSFHQHAMGRSMFTAAMNPPTEDYASKTNPFKSGRSFFQASRHGDKLIHKEWCTDSKGRVVAELESEMAFSVGSGAQARSYLFQRDGFLYQSPITWYPQKSKWDLSPGYEDNQFHFNRKVEQRCLYCHCQTFHHVENTVNRYKEPILGQAAIGCERCHGPGELHVATRRQGQNPGEIDRTIVNPRHLEPMLRDAICEQCHLQGEAIIVRRGRSQTDYRPGLPLHEYMSILVRPPDATDSSKIVSHVEQMHLSTCFKKSNGKLGCTSCHDPHGAPTPTETMNFYKQRCLNCHSSASTPKKSAVTAPECSVPLAERTAQDARDNCMTCHMGRNPSSNATHLTVTDHRVLRKPLPPSKPVAKGATNEIPLVPFHAQWLKDEQERDRDFGLALVHLATTADSAGSLPLRDFLTRKAQPLLEKAASRAPNDLAAVEGHSFTLFALNRHDEGMRQIETALTQAPNREETLSLATRIADTHNKLEIAERHCRKLVETYPQTSEYHHRLGIILGKRQVWPQALTAAQTCVKLDPFNAKARALVITALLETGGRAQAEAEFEVLGAIDPAYQSSIRAWFNTRLQQTR